VDDLLDEVVAALTHLDEGRPGDVSLTAEQVRKVRFRAVTFARGDELAQVDELLERVEHMLGGSVPEARHPGQGPAGNVPEARHPGQGPAGNVPEARHRGQGSAAGRVAA